MQILPVTDRVSTILDELEDGGILSYDWEDLEQDYGELEQGEARALLNRVIWALMYEERNPENDLPYNSVQVSKMFAEGGPLRPLYRATRYRRRLTRQWVLTVSKRENDKKWRAQFGNRASVARHLFQNRVQEIGRIAERLIANIEARNDLDAVNEYARVIKLEMDMVGYGAPRRFAVGPDLGEDQITPEHIQHIREARKMVSAFEEELLSGVEISGYLEEGDLDLDEEVRGVADNVLEMIEEEKPASQESDT